jgi:hypothetical protein
MNTAARIAFNNLIKALKIPKKQSKKNMKNKKTLYALKLSNASILVFLKVKIKTLIFLIIIRAIITITTGSILSRAIVVIKLSPRNILMKNIASPINTIKP